MASHLQDTIAVNIVAPIRRTLRRIPSLRNRRYRFHALRYAGRDLYEVSPFDGIRLLARNEDLIIVDEIFQRRRYATLFPFRQEATVIDIGAHCGYFSVFAGLNLADGSRIIGLEPDATNRNLARLNLDRNGLGFVELYPQGVAGRSESVLLYTQPEATAQHTVIPNRSSDHAAKAESVDVIGMADLFHRLNCRQCHFMKVDCEGAEYSFFYGAPADALRDIGTISMEFHDFDGERTTGTDLAAYFVSHGFTIVDFRYQPTHQNRNYGVLLVTRKW
jgi:FkbM family methyltransferase